MAVSDREFTALSVLVHEHSEAIRLLREEKAERRGEAREAARIASRLVAGVSLVAVLVQLAVGLYFHDHNAQPRSSHSSSAPAFLAVRR